MPAACVELTAGLATMSTGSAAVPPPLSMTRAARAVRAREIADSARQPATGGEWEGPVIFVPFNSHGEGLRAGLN